MTDLALESGGTISCPTCANQVDLTAASGGQVTCDKCGTTFEASVPADAQRGDLEIGEVVRGLGVLGWDTDLTPDEAGGVTCANCGQRSEPGQLRVEQVREVRDDQNSDGTKAVVAARCPSCDAQGLMMLNIGDDGSTVEREILASLR